MVLPVLQAHLSHDSWWDAGMPFFKSRLADSFNHLCLCNFHHPSFSQNTSSRIERYDVGFLTNPPTLSSTIIQLINSGWCAKVIWPLYNNYLPNIAKQYSWCHGRQTKPQQVRLLGAHKLVIHLRCWDFQTPEIRTWSSSSKYGALDALQKNDFQQLPTTPLVV